MTEEEEKNKPLSEEAKKWRIDRVQTLIVSDIEELESERARVRSENETVENTITTWRNAFLTATSFFAPVILAAYYNDYYANLMLAALVVDALIGLVAGVVLTIAKSKVHRLILLMDRDYFTAINTLINLKWVFIAKSYGIEKIEPERIYFYWGYNLFAKAAVSVYLIDIYKDMASSIFFKSARTRLAFKWQEQRESVKQAKNEFEKLKPLSNEYSDDAKLLDIHLKEFHNYKPESEIAIMTEVVEPKKPS